MPDYFRHLIRTLCLIFIFYMIGIECGISFDAYSRWRNMLKEDYFCPAPWRTYNSNNELSERDQLKKISYGASVSIKIIYSLISITKDKKPSKTSKKLIE